MKSIIVLVVVAILALIAPAKAVDFIWEPVTGATILTSDVLKVNISDEWVAFHADFIDSDYNNAEGYITWHWSRFREVNSTIQDNWYNITCGVGYTWTDLTTYKAKEIIYARDEEGNLGLYDHVRQNASYVVPLCGGGGGGSPSASPSESASRTPSPSVSPSRTPSPSGTSSATPSISLSATTSGSLSATPSPTPSPSVTPSRSISATPSRTASVSPSVTPSLSVTPSRSISATPSRSMSASRSVTPSLSVTPSRSISATPSRSLSASRSVTPSLSVTPSRSISATPSRSLSASRSVTPSLSVTPSRSRSATPSQSFTQSPSVTPSRSVTPSLSRSATSSPSVTPSRTASPSPSLTPSPSSTPSATPSATASPSLSATPSSSPSRTASPSVSPSPSPINVRRRTVPQEVRAPEPSPNLRIVIDGARGNYYMLKTGGELGFGSEENPLTVSANRNDMVFSFGIRDWGFSSMSNYLQMTSLVSLANGTEVVNISYTESGSVEYVTLQTNDERNLRWFISIPQFCVLDSEPVPVALVTFTKLQLPEFPNVQLYAVNMFINAFNKTMELYSSIGSLNDDDDLNSGGGDDDDDDTTTIAVAIAVPIGVVAGCLGLLGLLALLGLVIFLVAGGAAKFR